MEGFDHERVRLILDLLHLHSCQGNSWGRNNTEASSSRSSVNSFSYPTGSFSDHSQLLQHPDTTVVPELSNRVLFSSTSPADHSPPRIHLSQQQLQIDRPSMSPYIPYPDPLQIKWIPTPQEQLDLFQAMAHPRNSNQVVNKVKNLNKIGSLESKVEIKKVMLILASDPWLLLHCAWDTNGSHALQQLIKILKKSCPVDMSNLTQALAASFPYIAVNGSGRHVIKECFKELRAVHIEVLCRRMVEHFFKLATHQQGCILLNECLPYMTSIYKDLILEKIVLNAESLAQDRFGTYVVQEAIRKQHPSFTPRIVQGLRNSIIRLSTQKEGSHLVEKCLGCPSARHIVIEELLKLNSTELCDLACNDYGNYVIQNALSLFAQGESVEVKGLALRLRQALQSKVKDLQLNPVGHKVAKKFRGIRIDGKSRPI